MMSHMDYISPASGRSGTKPENSVCINVTVVKNNVLCILLLMGQAPVLLLDKSNYCVTQYNSPHHSWSIAVTSLSSVGG